MPMSIQTANSATEEDRPVDPRKSLKILVSAFAASPDRGSEYAVGWEWIRSIGAQHHVWAITMEASRGEIEEYIRRHPTELSNVSFHYIPYTRSSQQGPLWYFVHIPRYLLWQRRCFALAKALDKQFDFDLVHQLTGTGFREPGFLWKLGKPFVWGPMGGLHYFPVKFLRFLPLTSALFVLAKNLTTAWMMHLATRPRRAAKASAAIIASTSNTAVMVRDLWRKSSTILSPVTPPELEQLPPPQRAPGEPLQLVWCGRNDPFKALKLLLFALQKLREISTDSIRWKLTVVGTGIMEGECIRLARDCGISQHCKFAGRVPRNQALTIMRTGHVFIHTSLFELAPTVIVEAMQVGMPVVGLNHFGLADAIDDTCGILIPPMGVNRAIEGFAKAIWQLWDNENLRYNMALKAQEAARHVSWNIKVPALNALYEALAYRSALTPSPDRTCGPRQLRTSRS